MTSPAATAPANDPTSVTPTPLPVATPVAAALTAVCTVAFLVFIGSGSVGAYWLGALLFAGAAFTLGRHRHWGAALLIVVAATLLGTELRAELGPAGAFLGGVRALDLTVLSAGIGVLSAVLSLDDLRSPSRLLALVRPWWAVGLTFAIVVALWAVNGRVVDALLNTDARLVLLGAGTYVTARYTVPGHERAFVQALVALSVLLAIKAVALHLSDLWTVGVFDRSQATQVGSVPKRTILIGGDTLLILAPGAAIAVLDRARSNAFNAFFVLAAILCMGAVILSGTRSSLIVAVALVYIAPFLCWPPGQLPRSRKAIPVFLAASAVVFGMVAGATALSGVGERFVQAEASNQGLGFRRDEINSAKALPAQQLVIGQGLGGNFTTRNEFNTRAPTAWSHVLPIWIVLKVGLLGLAILSAIGLVAFYRTMSRRPAFGPRVATLLFGGLVVMSLTIGRLALPEGVVLTATFFVLFGWGVPREPASASSPASAA